MKLLQWLGHQRRRRLGRYEINDPRPIAQGAPYTYYLPSENEVLALVSGDRVKLLFRSIPPGPKFEIERMWVTIAAIDGDIVQGELDNVPSDMPQVRLGDTVSFKRSDVIDIIWADDRGVPPPSAPPRRWYWERCLVDRCVLDDDAKVHYIYREEPDMAKDSDEYPDSGWRIRGDWRDATDGEVDDRELAYVALGAVLNRDDSWLAFIDQPIGSAFIRNWETGAFEIEES
jgi:hypothetical protein